MHIAVALFGFTAILGRLIQLNELSIVWWRLLLTCGSLLFFPAILSRLVKIPRKELLQLAGIGIIVALHWVLFYGSIKYSNVSVALCALSTASFFTAFIEPAIFKERIKVLEVATGLLVIPGMYIIFYTTDVSYTRGIIMGLFSAVMAALFSTLNKKMVNRQAAMSITFVELGSGLIFLSLLMPFYWEFMGDGTNLFLPVKMDWVYLALLAFFCTTLAYIFALQALKHISAFISALTINLEPVYGIILAIIIFQENEEVGRGFYLGAAIILAAVFGYPLLKRISAKAQKKEKP